MIDILLGISLSLMALSLMCFLFGYYGWRLSLLIVGIGAGLLRIIIEVVFGLKEELSQVPLILLWLVILFFVTGTIMAAIGVHLQEIETYKGLGLIRNSKQRGKEK